MTNDGQMMRRRSFLSGMAALIAAPAVIRVSNLMPIKPVITRPYAVITGVGWNGMPEVVELWEPMSAMDFGQKAHEVFQSVHSWEGMTASMSDDAVDRYIAERKQREAEAKQAWRDMHYADRLGQIVKL